MIKQMLETINKHEMIHANDKIVVGISGGPDSLAMLHALYHFKETFKIDLIAVHINHMFRGNLADADEAFVEAFCKQYQIPLFSYRVDVSEYAKEVGTSFEDAGRRVRYQYFHKVKESEKAQKIAVAHNKNDLIETFFINMFRGAGIDGLASIDYTRDSVYIRPLLDVSRAEIETYCVENHLSPRRDHTNDENNYLRNKIRNELIPMLKDHYNPGLDSTLYKTIQIMKGEKEFWEVHADNLFNAVCKWENNTVRIHKPKFDGLHEAERFRLMRLCIQKIRGSLHNISLDLIKQACGLSKVGTFVYLDMEHKIHLVYDHLVLEPIIPKEMELEKEPKLTCVRLDKAGYQSFRHKIAPSDMIAVDMDKIVGDLHMRHRQNGDVFKPLGMKGHKKLKDFLIDEKVPKDERDKLWLVCDENEILWVHPLRMSDSCKITEETENILLISFIDVVEGLELC